MSKAIPDVRFDGFSGDWEEKFLGNEVEFYSGLTYSPEDIVTKNGTLVIRSSNVKNGELIDADNVYVDPSIVNSQKVKIGDIIVVVRNGSRHLIGKHATVKRNLDNTVIGAFMTGIRSENSYFMNATLDTTQFAIEINKNLGATINQITIGNFKKMKFFLPNLIEQQKIGNFFKQLDDMIALQQQLVEQQQQYRKAMLQKMFPQKGECVPKVRFDGFSGDWEERVLGNEVEFYSGLTYSPEDIVTRNGTLVIRSSNVKNGELVDADNVYVDSSIVNSEKIKIGDIIVVVRNGSRHLIGKHATVKRNLDNTVIGAFMTGIRSENFNFMNAILDTTQFAIEINKNLGSTINQITTGNFKKMKFFFPSVKEQQKVGTFFKQLDDTIAFHQKKLKDYQQLKKALLQRMFV